jgi:hypothetical protein
MDDQSTLKALVEVKTLFFIKFKGYIDLYRLGCPLRKNHLSIDGSIDAGGARDSLGIAVQAA